MNKHKIGAFIAEEQNNKIVYSYTSDVTWQNCEESIDHLSLLAALMLVDFLKSVPDKKQVEFKAKLKEMVVDKIEKLWYSIQ